MCKCTAMSVYRHVRIHIYIHRNKHIRTHTRTHAHTTTYIYILQQELQVPSVDGFLGQFRVHCGTEGHHFLRHLDHGKEVHCSNRDVK